MAKNATPRAARRILGKNLVRLPIDKLEVDQIRYQRDILSPHVNTIVKNWNPDLFTPPIVGQRRSGEYYILDGQQRITAVRILDIYDDVLVVLLQPKTIQEEAALFTQMNQGSKKLKARELHKANVASGEPIAMAIEEVLEKYNFTAKPASRERMITAITKLRGAWGAAGARSGLLLSQAQLQEGKDVLEWAIDAGSPMILSNENACTIYSEANLSSLIWIRRTSIHVPDLDEVKTALTGVHPRWLTTHLADTTVPGGTMSARWGTRLALFANDQNQKETVDLPQEIIDRYNAWVADFKAKN